MSDSALRDAVISAGINELDRRDSYTAGYLAAARAAIEYVCDALEHPVKGGWFGEDVDGDYLAAQTIRERFLTQLKETP
jgi:hypothetical protein